MTTTVATITEYRNAVSLSADNARMDVEINHPTYGWIPYTIDPTDTDTTIDNAALLALVGDDFAPSTQEARDAATAASVRASRDSLLATQVDPIVSNPLRWDAMTDQQKADMSSYRTSLLNVPQQSGFPNTVSWPTL